MDVRVIGSGEAFDSAVGNNAFLLRAGRGQERVRLLIDCGYQIPERLWAENLHRGLDGIYLTHTHADHAFGVVPLLARFWEEGREQPLTILGHRGVKSFVTKAMALGYPGMTERFRYRIEYLATRPGIAQAWQGLKIRTARSQHGVTNLSVRIAHGDREVAFSGDGAITPDTQALYDGADVLFHELFSVRRPVPGHTDLAALKRMMAQIDVDRLVVSHHARRYKAAVQRGVAKLGPKWVCAEPGQVYTI